MAAQCALPGWPEMITRCLLVLSSLLLPLGSVEGKSRCFGTSDDGRMQGGVSLPLTGANFSAYSVAGWSLGRTYVHSTVREILLEAYKALEKASPGTVFVYGETGWPGGGRFRPHKTHQNGLSVDLMVPVLLDGKSVPLPGAVFNRYGYDLEFNDQGRYEGYSIDFEALAELIHQIHRAAESRGAPIRRVIFEVPLQKHLWQTGRGAFLRQTVAFSSKAAWVRHDEHIHVDFALACGPM